MEQTLSLNVPFIIEILDRFGKVKQRSRCEKFPFIIGRGYNNDIIIDDPYISPTHLKIDCRNNSIMIVEDINSENGLFSTSPLKQQDNLIIHDNLRIRIGHTDIRFRSLDHPVYETAIQRSTPSKLSMLTTNFFTFPIVWLFTGLLFFFDEYLSATGKFSTSSIIASIFAMYLLFAIWAGLWSLASKIVTHRFYFSFHAVIICILIAFITLVEIISENIEFAFSLVNFSWWTLAVVTLFSSLALIYSHLSFSSTLSKKKMLIAAILTSGSINFVVHLTNILDQPEYSSKLVYSNSIKTPELIVSRIRSSNDFFASAIELKQKVDNLALEK